MSQISRAASCLSNTKNTRGKTNQVSVRRQSSESQHLENESSQTDFDRLFDAYYNTLLQNCVRNKRLFWKRGADKALPQHAYRRDRRAARIAFPNRLS